MKLLHIIASMDPKLGGVCQAVRTIIAGLTEQGVQSEVASLDAPDAPWIQVDLFPSHALGPGRGPWGYGSNFMPWLIHNLHLFDVVILHGLWLYHGYALNKVRRRFIAQHQAGSSVNCSLPKFFVMPHGMLDPYFQRATGRKLKAWRNWAYWQVIEGAVINEADGVLFTCEMERRLAHEPFTPYHPQKEIVVGLGVEEPPRCTPAMQKAFLANYPDLQNRPYLLFLSRIHEKKGVELLLQAYARIIGDLVAASRQVSSCTLNDSPASQEVQTLPALIIAGPGLETSYGQRMQQLAAELPEAAAVFFPGMLSGDAKWGAFYGCAAFVLPSYQENFGIAVVEALACGKPVLISNQVNIWREIESMGGGIVADNTLEGIQQLLKSWFKLTKPEKHAIEERAREAYYKYFAVAPAAVRMQAALQ
jgi:glycosyltransferase involved in cell wall biosynthesis